MLFRFANYASRQPLPTTKTHEPEFMQAVNEVSEDLIPYIVSQKIYHGKNILMRMTLPNAKFCKARFL